MNRFLKSIILGSFLGASSADARPPNIVFFLVDDLGWSDVGCYGSTFHETPHIDQLAKEGMRFDNAYSCLLYTSPSPRDRTRSRMPSSA